jgi:hypothetical protein
MLYFPSKVHETQYSKSAAQINVKTFARRGVCIIQLHCEVTPITVAARSKAWTVFARSNTGIVGSNPTRGMDVCVRLFCVCVVLCVGSGLVKGCSPVQGVLPTVYRIKELKKRPRSNKSTAEPQIDSEVTMPQTPLLNTTSGTELVKCNNAHVKLAFACDTVISQCIWIMH